MVAVAVAVAAAAAVVVVVMVVVVVVVVVGRGGGGLLPTNYTCSKPLQEHTHVTRNLRYFRNVLPLKTHLSTLQTRPSDFGRVRSGLGVCEGCEGVQGVNDDTVARPWILLSFFYCTFAIASKSIS